MSAATAIGSVIDGKYEIVGVIGRGGMSVVWLGRDVRLEKTWAVKEVLPNDGGERGRLLRQAIVDEANFIKRLDHPAIPRVVDIIDTGDSIFVVMDYVNGQSLKSLLSLRGKPFPQEDVVRWGIELCDVLSYLHGFVTPDGERHQVIYRDLKPANVMLRDDGSVRLIDFGVCWERTGGQNNDGRVVGTPGYASPEQLPTPIGLGRLREDAVIDGRSDIYALGATLYSLVCGHVPKVTHDGEGNPSVSFPMRPIRAWNPELSEGLERIIAKATQREPSQRYQTVAEMRYDLEHYEQLTHEYRDAQRLKVAGFRHRLTATFGLVLCGFVCLGLSATMRARSYEACLRAASIASCESADGARPSEAEVLYTRAIDADPSHAEPFSALVRDVYEADNVFTASEEERWNELFRSNEPSVQRSEGYAQLCFDAGVCYLCFYGLDAYGSLGTAVGQEAIVNAGKARVWFERVEQACGVRRDGDVPNAGGQREGQTIEDADLLAAGVYLRIAEFNDLKQRAMREGRSAGDDYASFWEALRNAVGMSGGYIEGVRLRLYQIAFEAIAADDVLDGIYRKALADERVDESRAEVEGLLAQIVAQLQTDAMRRFATAPGNRDVYGPIYHQIVDNVELARRNIAQTYDNPVARLERVPGQAGEGERS